jgi:hypothetical protein
MQQPPFSATQRDKVILWFPSVDTKGQEHQKTDESMRHLRMSKVKHAEKQSKLNKIIFGTYKE